MKNYDEMYQSVLSKYDEYLEKKRKRIRTIRRTVPVLACFCIVLVFGLVHWDHLKDLMNPPIQPDIIVEQPTDTTESTLSPHIAATTESSPTQQTSPAISAVTTHSPPWTEANGTSASGNIRTAVSVENGGRNSGQQNSENTETETPAATAPVSEIIPISPPQTTANGIQTQPATKNTAPVQITDEPPLTTEIEPQPVNNDSRLLYPIGKQISIERYKAMAAASYMIYNDIQTSAATTAGTGTTQTTAAIPSETTTTVTPDDTQIALKKLTDKENRLFGEFRRERAVILGELSPDAPRLTLDETAAIIDSSGSFAEICRKLHETQPLPDYIGGSGITRLEYWFDDKGTQKIYLIMEEESIFYFKFNGADMIYS